ncbi:hypothetical protein GGQ65_005034 [Rhizobium fabae]|uniref:Uncharacterized protein n=1 Tax=Rhizobium fabae TaxID=573179 RepID=A0A7W6BG16_9HYPH|nr:hypothetical protein [Rhizobium fabae]
MTLGEIVDQHRLRLSDESVGVRRSWEEMFRYTLRQYPKDTPLEAFDLVSLAKRLAASGMQDQIVAGYIKRWQTLLAQTSTC